MFNKLKEFFKPHKRRTRIVKFPNYLWGEHAVEMFKELKPQFEMYWIVEK